MKTYRRAGMGLLIAMMSCGAATAQDGPPAVNVPRENLPKTERIRQPLPDVPAGPKPAPPPFVIGVWYQPMASFATWKARGVNTVFGYESESGRVSLEDWNDSAGLVDLFMVRQPRESLPDDAKEPRLLAWMQPDEPDVKNVDPARLAATFQIWKQANRDMPVFLNVSGGNAVFRKTKRETYVAYFASADWIGNDFYPVTGWNDLKLLPKVGQVVDLLREWSGGKPQYAFIETSAQRLDWTPPETRGVTPDEMRAEIWDAVIHGVRGIVYFPQQIGRGFQFDATPENVSVEMSKQNRFLTELGPVLALPANPKGVTVTVKPPLEAAWRKGEDGSAYVIVLNLSDKLAEFQKVTCAGTADNRVQVLNEENRTLTVDGGSLIDRFLPYQVHVYHIGAP